MTLLSCQNEQNKNPIWQIVKVTLRSTNDNRYEQHYQSVTVNPIKFKTQIITPITISAICLPLYEVCSVTIMSAEFRFAKFNALNGKIRKTTPIGEINQNGPGSFTNKFVKNNTQKAK